MGRYLYANGFVALGVVVGKCCQYGAVAMLAPRLGFEAASVVGLVPFIAALMMLKVRYPRYFALRAARDRA